MMNKKRAGQTKQSELPCPVCGERVATTTVCRDGSGAMRTLSSRPGELTTCEPCGRLLEYGGRIGALTLKRAPRDRVRAFRELERDTVEEPRFPELVAYVIKFRIMPPSSGTMRLRYFCRSRRD